MHRLRDSSLTLVIASGYPSWGETWQEPFPWTTNAQLKALATETRGESATDASKLVALAQRDEEQASRLSRGAAMVP
eukprot:519568-Hanusia_phi.AAC.2